MDNIETGISDAYSWLQDLEDMIGNITNEIENFVTASEVQEMIDEALSPENEEVVESN